MPTRESDTADMTLTEIPAPPLRIEPALGSDIASPGRRALRRFVRHRLAIVGLITIAVVTLLAVIGSEEAALTLNLRAGYTNQPPGALPGYPLGTDALGRDILSRTLVGGRISILVALISVAIATGIGTTIGVIAGYAGGWVDTTIMRFVDIVLSFPTILLLLVVAFLVGPGLVTMMVMIGLVTWAPGARIIRGQVLALRGTTFIEAARVIGVSGPRMIVSHILPNIVAPLVVFATFGVATVIVFEASLSYLGLGVQPPTPSWGNLLQATRVVTVLERYTWQWIPPATFIVLMVLAVNFVGDGLRDAFDQRATSER
jgi:peptide/nickel transport system permease protein